MERSVSRMWERFTREIVPQHQFFQKWKGQSRDLKEGDVVYVLGDKKRGQWPVGIIKEIKSGLDTHVREAMVQVRGEQSWKRLSLHRMGLLQPVDGEDQ